MTTLVDMARANYPEQHRCRHCSNVVNKIDSRWLDGAGSADCPTGGTEHWGVPDHQVGRSPLLGMRSL